MGKKVSYVADRSHYRQGDVYVWNIDPESIGAAFDTSKMEKVDHKTVAYGEISGHHHVLQGNDIELFRTPAPVTVQIPGGSWQDRISTDLFAIDRGTGNRLAHIDEATGGKADHDAITFPKDKKVRVFAIRGQAEYNPATRNVDSYVLD